ncbi:hypothetical protein [Mobiluncus curtisii]|uniref:hypothetical protein n=1 Tax=Mobiluncus curtisii TaxID=2051 RepID=UPI0014707083|nr:hypothetical protein [Mobiluncus curtisii]NMW44407.1 hypothetical protein [Mobiluncus curtisii]NMW98522.1 hypothetical protein [Mobiluncus curtisii]NMX06134.1 hypothetical protein [Mobiluncus curtisii]
MGHGSGFPATVPIESAEGNRSVGGVGTPTLSTGLPQRCNPVTKRGAHGAVGGGGLMMRAASKVWDSRPKDQTWETRGLKVLT